MFTRRHTLLTGALGLGTVTGVGGLHHAFSGQEAKFSTRTAAIRSAIRPTVQVLRTAGFVEPGDFGGAQWHRAFREPSHPGKFQSADGAWWEIAETRLTPQMFGANGGANDSPACRACCAAAVALKVPVFVPNIYPFYAVPDGFCELTPAPGDALTVLSNGAELRATADRTLDIIGFYGDFVFPTPPAVRRGTRLTLQGLRLDGRGVPEQWEETDYFNGLRMMRGVGSSAEHLVIRDCQFRNIYGYGLRAYGVQTSTIDNCPTLNVGGRWHNDEFDAFGDSFYHAYAQEGALVSITRSPMKGYVGRYSRIGTTFEFSPNVYRAILEDCPMEGYDRTIHVEETSGGIRLHVRRCDMTRTRVGILVTGTKTRAQLHLADSEIVYGDGTYGGVSLVYNPDGATLEMDNVVMRATTQGFNAVFGAKTTLRNCVIDWNGNVGAIALSRIVATGTTFRGITDISPSVHTFDVALTAENCRFEGAKGALLADNAGGANWIVRDSVSNGPVVKAATLDRLVIES